MAYQILVVDDNLSAAREYSRLISLKTKLDAIPTESHQKALEIVQSEPIKVAILDQKMPGKKGTELFKDIHTIAPNVKVIMLSGEADPEEVDEAYKLGYVDYLHKSKVEELPDRVFILYTRYLIDLNDKSREESNIDLFKENYWLSLFKKSIEYKIHSIGILNDQHIFDDGWTTIKQINCGESVREKDTIQITERYIFEEKSFNELASNLSITPDILNILKTELKSKIGENTTETKITENKKTLEFTREYRLPDEPTNPNEMYVVSRHYQRANVYKKIRIVLIRLCNNCKLKHLFPLTIYQLTDKIATRQKDHFSDGNERVTKTGIELYE